MLVLGILGFHAILLLCVLAICFVIRQKLRNAAARKEEVMRLLSMASQEAVLAEVQASTEYTFLPKVYQCAVCFSPTTTRCARCKAVRYCSGKCQIIHWRRGHKDECCPPTAIMDFKEASDFDGREIPKKQLENTDAKATYSGFPSSSTSSSAGITPSGARGEPLVEASVREVQRSSTTERTENHFSVDTDSDICGSRSSVSKVKARSPPMESTIPGNCEDNVSHVRKLNKVKSVIRDEEVDFRTRYPKDKPAMSNNVQPEKLGNKRSTRTAASPEMVVTDTPEIRNLPSLNCLRSDSVTNNKEGDSKVFKGEKFRSLSLSVPIDLQSPTTRAHKDASSKAVLPAKVNSVPSLPHNAHNGLKTSVRKVVQQIRGAKSSKSYLLGSGNEVIGTDAYKISFPYELFVKLYSCDGIEICPFGLINCGNSCYANAVLQCLAFTRPLTSYLVRGSHSKACRKKEWCFTCEFECLIVKAKEGKSPLSPIRILSKIQKIGKHLGPGREEDAHEFLRYAVDTMQSVCLKEAEATGPLAEETTLVGLTFGGYLHSKIKCMNCFGKSERSERMMDLTVEIDGDIGSLEEALAQFTASEILDGEDRYHCSRCKSYEKAKKKLTVLEAPNILTIVLKRFQSGNFGKLNKSVRFPEVLNMAPYMSGKSDKSPVYSLYAVVVHLDVMNAALSGHYVCYVKNFQGEWFRIDDSEVMHVELDRVLLEGAYMLLYARHSPHAPALLRSNLESHGARSKRRNSDAGPSSLNQHKIKPSSGFPCVDSSAARQKHSRYHYWMNSDGPTSSQSFDSDNWRLHSIRRIPPVDSSSESSSLFSGSDASSCSTSSTKYSSQTEDFSDYLFGEVGPSW